MSSPTSPRSLAPALAQLAGWTAVGILNVVVVATFRRTTGSFGVQTLHHLYDFAQHVAMGVISAALLEGWLRWGPKRRGLGWIVFGAVAVVLGAWMLPEDTSILARKIAIRGSVTFWHALLVASASMGPLVGAIIARGLARPRIRMIGVGTGLALAAINHFIVAHDYPGFHFFLAWIAAILVAVSSATKTPEPVVLDRKRLSIFALLSFASLWSLVIPPSNAVRLALFRSAGSVVAPWVTRFQTRMVRSGSVAVSAESRPWFVSREQHGDIPPSLPALLPENAIVILLIVDTMRADLLEDRYAPQLPNIFRVKRAGANFLSAHTPAPATTQAMSAVFAGRYYSQLYFTAKAGRNPEAMYPHEDQTVRFPELLTRAGVDTVHLVGLSGLMVEYGVVRGFSEERLIPAPARTNFAGARELIPPAIERLKRQGPRPLFMYLHFNDPHFPYDLGGDQGTAFERYLAEVRGVDQALGPLLDAIDAAGLRERTAIILAADHGEGFGEHGQNFHATSLYEELLRVPLIVSAPGAKLRDVREPVSLIDLAPTILDFFRQPTPGIFMGESLAPWVAGKDPSLRRPVVADSARLMRALLFRDGMKLIEDRRRGTVELYDLAHDPAERDNLWDRGGSDAQTRLALLHAFFAEHTLKRPGYSPPYGR